MTMPAGKYYIGDLCYVLHDEWDEVCEIIFQTDHASGVRDGEFTLKDGRRFAIYSTAYGDGQYYDNYGRAYPVDAGSIGCVLESDIDVGNPDNNLSLGSIVEFTTDFETSGDRFTSKDWDGIIRFGIVEVDTDPVYDEEYGDVETDEGEY